MCHRALSEKQKSTSSSGICSKDYGFVLEAVDKGFVPVINSTKGMEHRETECSSKRLCDRPRSKCNLRTGISVGSSTFTPDKMVKLGTSE